MSKGKDFEETKEVQAFPDGYQMDSWNTDGRESDIAFSRVRGDEKRPNPVGTFKKFKGSAWFPTHEIPEGWQYILATERLLNEPQNNNLQDLYEEGWEFVNQSDHPTYMFRELYSNPDGHLRRKNMIVMKKRKEEYDSDQRSYRNESLCKQKDVMASTNYFGSAPNDPRFLVENSGSYTPTYRER